MITLDEDVKTTEKIVDADESVDSILSTALGLVKKKFPLSSRYYAETCNKWRSPSPRLNTWTTQL